MQKIWFIFNFTTLALLIWDVINASPRQLISLCRKLSPPFHQNSVTLAPVCTVVMQLGYQGNPKVFIFHCLIAVRQKLLLHTPYSLFLPKKNLIHFCGDTGVLISVLGTDCSWIQVHNAARFFCQHLFCCWVLSDCREFSRVMKGVSKFSFGKGLICQRESIYSRWEMQALLGLRARGCDSPLPFSQTHSRWHVLNAWLPVGPPAPTVKWLNILINCI